MLEDGALEPTKLRPWFYTEVVGERRSRGAVRLEGLALPAVEIERAHQLPPQPLAVRVLCDEGLQLDDECRRTRRRALPRCAPRSRRCTGPPGAPPRPRARAPTRSPRAPCRATGRVPRAAPPPRPPARRRPPASARRSRVAGSARCRRPGGRSRARTPGRASRLLARFRRVPCGAPRHTSAARRARLPAAGRPRGRRSSDPSGRWHSAEARGERGQLAAFASPGRPVLPPAGPRTAPEAGSRPHRRDRQTSPHADCRSIVAGLWHR